MNPRQTFFQSRKEKLILLLPITPALKLLELKGIYDLQIEQHSSRWFKASSSAYLVILGLVTLLKSGSKSKKVMLVLASVVLAYRQYEHELKKASLIQERELIKNEIRARQSRQEIQSTSEPHESKRHSCTIL